MSDAGAIQAALPDYEVTEELGRGAMGIVYRARHRQLDRTVAIKELPPAFAADESVRARFVAEAKTLAALDHAHVVVVHDFVDRAGQCLLVMEELPGGTLWERFVGEGLTPPVACAMTIAACSGLAHAHGRGVLHRDVKPENLMFSAEGQIKVTDFGIAKVVNGAAQLATADGSVLGTPAYMSPEQAHGDPVGPEADVYAAATMLYELLSGRLPFGDAEGPMAMLVRRISEPAPPITDVAGHVPGPLADAVMHGLEQKAADRTSDAETFACAVGTAAATAWGVSWIDSTGVVVRGSEQVDAAVRTTLVPAGGKRAEPGPTTTGAATGRTAETFVPGGDAVTPDEAERAAETFVPGADAVTPDEAERAAETFVPGDEATTADTDPVVGGDGESDRAAALADVAAVRPEMDRHTGGANLVDVDPRRLVSVSDLVSPPSRGRELVIAGVVLMLVAIVLAFVGLGDPSRAGDLSSGIVTIDGSDPAGGEPIELDLTEVVPITADGPYREAVISFSVAGLPLGEGTAELIDGVGELDPETLRWTVGGAVTAELSLEDPAGSGPTQEFAVEGTHPWYATATGIAGIVLALAGVAYVQSNLRPMRRGRPFRLAPVLALLVSGAVVGVAAVALAGVLVDVEPTVPTLVVAAALAGIGAGALGEGVRRVSRTRRIYRRRAQIEAGRR